MTDPHVNYETQDGIAVMTISNPPVNALSPGVPEGTGFCHGCAILPTDIHLQLNRGTA